MFRDSPRSPRIEDFLQADPRLQEPRTDYTTYTTLEPMLRIVSQRYPQPEVDSEPPLALGSPAARRGGLLHRVRVLLSSARSLS